MRRLAASGLIGFVRVVIGAVLAGALAQTADAQSAGVPIDLGTLGGGYTNSRANAINNAGQVVGSSYSALSSQLPAYAFLWTQGGGMMDLGSPVGPQNEALSINATGQVVGWSGRAVSPRAYSWTA